MKYMGSKSRIAKYILPIILKDRGVNQWYVEPFVGGCNMIDKVDGNRIGADANPYLISMWHFLCNGYSFPKEINRDLYKRMRDKFNNETFYGINEDAAMIGYVGFMGSFNGRFFDGGYSGHNVNGRDYISEQIRNTLSQVEKIKDVKFVFLNIHHWKYLLKVLYIVTHHIWGQKNTKMI